MVASSGIYHSLIFSKQLSCVYTINVHNFVVIIMINFFIEVSV